jgi:hypothetical protein
MGMCQAAEGIGVWQSEADAPAASIANVQIERLMSISPGKTVVTNTPMIHTGFCAVQKPPPSIAAHKCAAAEAAAPMCIPLF